MLADVDVGGTDDVAFLDRLTAEYHRLNLCDRRVHTHLFVEGCRTNTKLLPTGPRISPALHVQDGSQLPNVADISFAKSQLDPPLVVTRLTLQVLLDRLM